MSRRTTTPRFSTRVGVVMLSIAATAAATAQEEAPQSAAAELAGRHRQWLAEEVVYIISEIEREAFLMLESDDARDAFIDAFWRARDPSPGTIGNEAKDEHERRIAYANRYLGVETPRQGWQTDRGRIYIQLGEPAERQTYADPRAFYPIELWFYRSDPIRQGLPAFFYVMFFRPLQSGEYRMYDPITDGPGALAKDMMLQMADPREIVHRLLTGVGHEVALASINLIPSEPTDLSRPRASSRNSFLFSAIEQAPTKGLDDRYARDFVASRGDVEATVVFDPMPVQLSASAFWDERGLPYLHYGVEVAKDSALMGEYEGEYAISLQLGYDVADARGQRILLDSDVIEERFDEERARQIMEGPLAYYDRVALVPGVYDLTVTLANRLTQDDSVTSTRVSVADTSSESSMLSDLLVATSASPLGTTPAGGSGGPPSAFQFGGEQFSPAAGGRLPVDGIAELFLQMVAMPGLDPSTTAESVAMLIDEDGNEVASSNAAPVAVVTPPRPTPLRLSLPLSGASAGPHTLQVSVVLSNGQALSRHAPVELVAAPSFQRPEIFAAREVQPRGIEEYQHRGWQHLRKGELRAAESYIAIAVDNEPQNVALRRSLAGVRLNLGEHAAAVDTIRPLAGSAGASSIDLLIYSQALRGAGNPTEAADVARTIVRTDPAAPAYNALAEALVDLGNTAEAIAAYEASLALVPEQPAIREALERLRR